MIENVGNKNKQKRKRLYDKKNKKQSSKPLVCGELDLLCWKSQNQNQRPRSTMSVCHIFGFAATKHTSMKTPTFSIAVIWRHRTGKEKERKTFIKQHADWYWPLHVVTMQGAKHHMQVIFRDLWDWRRKTLIYGGRLGALAFCLWAERRIQIELQANIKSDLGGVWIRSGEDKKICESVRMVRREKIGSNKTHLHPKIIMSTSCVGNSLIQQAVKNRRTLMLL